jgi:translation initiation factor 1
VAKSNKKRFQGEGWQLHSAEPSCSPAPVESLPPDKQRIQVRVEKRRKGKVVTVASGFTLTDADLAALAKVAKSSCGCGGTIGEGELELQGERVEQVKAFLAARGYKV